MARSQSLAGFLREQAMALGSQLAVAKASDVSTASISRLLHGASPTDTTYRKLVAAFGDTVPSIIRTETDRRRERAYELLREHGQKSRSATAKLRAVRARRGHARPRQSVAMKRVWATRPRAADERLTAFVRSPAGRASVSLGAYLRWTPRPSKAELEQWAEAVGARVALSSGDVLDIWAPILRDRGVVAKLGAPPLERRHESVEAELAKRPRTLAGRMPRGTWEAIAEMIEHDEEKPITGDALRKWYEEHLRVCAGARGGTASRRARTQTRAEQAAANRTKARADADAAYARFVTVGEAAWILGVNKSTVQVWEQDGRLPTTGAGRRRFPRYAILALRGKLEPARCTAKRADGKRCKTQALKDDERGRCNAHARPSAACGTPSGYNAHYDRGELPCDACRQASARDRAARKTRRRQGDTTDRRLKAA